MWHTVVNGILCVVSELYLICQVDSQTISDAHWGPNLWTFMSILDNLVYNSGPEELTTYANNPNNKPRLLSVDHVFLTSYL